jgi:adhesin HecA-like repeat protein
MYCKGPFTAEGEVRLTGARIGGQLDFSGATLTNPGGYALAARGITVTQDLDFMDGFSAQGEVFLLDARVGGRLDFEGATLDNPGGDAANLAGSACAVLFLLPRTKPEGVIDLTSAQAGSYCDDPETWPSTMRLRGFAYGTLENDTISLSKRLAWLKHNGDRYAPGPYYQLAGAYRRAGRTDAARRVAIARERERRAGLSWPGRAWNWLLYVTVGYGYRTWLAGAWLCALLIAGSAVFASSYPAHMHRASPVVPAFQPVIYTLDVLIPVVNFGQQQGWIPQGPALALSWLLIAAGWILTTAIAVGLANALKPD